MNSFSIVHELKETGKKTEKNDESFNGNIEDICSIK